jgi:hypothetical protein
MEALVRVISALPRYVAIAAITLTSPSANAGLLRADYTGTVLSILGGGLGFSPGDAVTGTLYIDTDFVGPLSFYSGIGCEGIDCNGADYRFVTSERLGLGDSYAENSDLVNVTENTGPGGPGAQYLIRNGSQQTEVYDLEYELISYYSPTLDLVNGTGLLQSFIDAPASGLLHRSRFDGTTQLFTQDDVLFTGTLSVVQIPEPNSLITFASGMLLLV